MIDVSVPSTPRTESAVGSVTRSAVIGDVGGHVAHLRHALGQLGVTDTTWPNDLHVIQVGDLFGGRAHAEVVQLVGPHLRARRWTQLIGNSEPSAESRSGAPAGPSTLKPPLSSDAGIATASSGERQP